MLLSITEPGQSQKSEPSSPAIGIDLGTTYSVVAVVQDGLYRALEIDGSTITPSVVAYENGNALVGQKAKQSAQAIHSIKRLMGLSAAEAAQLGGHLAPWLSDKATDMPRLKLDGALRTPVEISAEILKALKEGAEKALGCEVHKAVITVPAYFSENARNATKDAARLAGLDVPRLINEPTAAALAYGLDEGSEGLYAVFDLGGGTFDFSVLDMRKGVFRVLATGGDTVLGGDDIDEALAEYIQKKTGGKLQGRAALTQARAIKEALSDADEAEGITRLELEQLARPFILRSIKICESVLHDAGLDKTAIKGVVLVGGSTRMPAVRKAVETCFGQKPITELDPDKVVAYGAALQTQALTRGSDTLLLDVTPLSLGLETYGDLVERIIERNTTIPVSKAQEFTTYKDGQTSMKIHVLQGEREMVAHCRSLAEFNLSGIPPMKAGLARIKVTFMLDAGGLLTVAAEELTTGAKQEIAVKPSYGLPPEEMERMLEESFKHAKEDILARLVQEARVEAQLLLDALGTALAESQQLLTEAEARAITAQMDIVKRAMQGTDREAIDSEVQLMDKIAGAFMEKRLNQTLKNALAGKTTDQAERITG